MQCIRVQNLAESGENTTTVKGCHFKGAGGGPQQQNNKRNTLYSYDCTVRSMRTSSHHLRMTPREAKYILIFNDLRSRDDVVVQVSFSTK